MPAEAGILKGLGKHDSPLRGNHDKRVPVMRDGILRCLVVPSGVPGETGGRRQGGEQ